VRNIILFVTIILCNHANAQWSTLPYADSGLYVCPGFEPGIVTFEDGSSIVLGLLSSYIYAQKLDPEGYKIWSTPVLVFQNDSSDMVLWKDEDRTWYCTDGDGGVIIYWQDYRGAYYTQMGPKNNTTYIQRVDKEGNIRWGVNGIKVNNLEDGLKNTRITSDGNDGCILLWSEIGFGYPNAPDKNYLKIARYNANGERLWFTILDTTFSNTYIDPNNIFKGGFYYYFSIYYDGDFKQRLINENGALSSYFNLPITALESSNDQNNVFSNDYSSSESTYKVSKIDFNGDTLWTTIVYYGNFCPETGSSLLPDNKGGTYLVHVCNDSLIYFDSLGYLFYKEFNGIEIGGTTSPWSAYYPDGYGGILVANIDEALRFNSNGQKVWPEKVFFLKDSENAYSENYISDNNGGLIIVYWSTLGGIYAQHTGRNGNLGIVTTINNQINNFPSEYFISQNYPNPFNPSTSFQISISQKALVKVKVYDILGRQVQILVNTTLEMGIHEIQWNASFVSSGIYFYILEVNGKRISTHKMSLTK
jgi:hypothetical protein